jgi:hypothetical protein
MYGWNIQIVSGPSNTKLGDLFHFWDRNVYGEPQFGDAHHAKRYSTLAGCKARVRALKAAGYWCRPIVAPY